MKQIRFSENLKSLREQKNLKQSELGQLLNVDQRTISTWERGISEPNFEMLAKICDIFDETFDNILT